MHAERSESELLIDTIEQIPSESTLIDLQYRLNLLGSLGYRTVSDVHRPAVILAHKFLVKKFKLLSSSKLVDYKLSHVKLYKDSNSSSSRFLLDPIRHLIGISDLKGVSLQKILL